MLDDEHPPVVSQPIPPPPPPEPIDRSTHAPIVMGVLRSPLSAPARAPEPTLVNAAAAVPRAPAPRLADVQIPGGDFPRAQLTVASTGVQRRRGTVVPKASQPLTRPAMRGRELRGGYRSSPQTAVALSRIRRRLLRQGHAVAPGDVLVLRMPNARHDDEPARPHLNIAGDQLVRLVGLDRSGAPSWERTVREAAVRIPRSTERIAVIGRGAAQGGREESTDAGLSGWHSQTLLHQVASRTYLAPRSVVRAASPRTRREGSAVTVANVTAHDATVGRTVITYLPPTTRVVLVGLSSAAPVGAIADAMASITIGLDGADRRRRGDGSHVPPKVVSSGDQVFGVFAVAAHTGDRRARWIRVTIESDTSWNVVAVGGSEGSPDQLVEDLRHGDPAELFSAAPDPSGAATIAFAAAEPGRPDEERRN